MHSFFYGFEHASQILVIAFPQGFLICVGEKKLGKNWDFFFL
jgi:hypothetical protein